MLCLCTIGKGAGPAARQAYIPNVIPDLTLALGLPTSTVTSKRAAGAVPASHRRRSDNAIRAVPDCCTAHWNVRFPPVDSSNPAWYGNHHVTYLSTLADSYRV